jgi:NFACT N-terminal and middle domains/NFACT protein RNA binding domain
MMKKKKNRATRAACLALLSSITSARAWAFCDTAPYFGRTHRRCRACEATALTMPRSRTGSDARLRKPLLRLSPSGRNDGLSSDLDFALFDDGSSDDEGLLLSWESATPDESDKQVKDDNDELRLLLLQDDDPNADSEHKSDQAELREQPAEPESVDPWGEEYRLWMGAAERALQNLQKKRRSLEGELAKAKSIETTVRRANYITSNMYLFTPGLRSVTIQDWESGNEFELVLDPAFDSASQEADALFQQARKLKRGSQKVEELLEETSAALATLSDILQDFSGVEVVNEPVVRLLQSKLLRTSGITGFEAPSAQQSKPQSRPNRSSAGKSAPPLGSPSSNVRKIRSPAGSIILVGRNRRGNEYLSLSAAKGNDLWLHARGTPGAHVLIPQRRGSPAATPECLQLAANVAVFYSDARSERRADVTVASPKHIIKPRNAPMGAVQLRQEERVVVGFPSDVPEDLRLARDESGQIEEYRARDKSKNRKKTTTAAAAAASATASKARSKRKRSKSL